MLNRLVLTLRLMRDPVLAYSLSRAWRSARTLGRPA